MVIFPVISGSIILAPAILSSIRGLVDENSGWLSGFNIGTTVLSGLVLSATMLSMAMNTKTMIKLRVRLLKDERVIVPGKELK